MKALFRISTDLISLDWRSVSTNQPAILATSLPVLGRFKITPRSAKTRLLSDTWKAFPEQISNQPNIELGPALFEETDYQVYLRAKNLGDTVELQHRDPAVHRSATAAHHTARACP